jgi:dihydroceramide fatty acyl 2-hydroxylase
MFCAGRARYTRPVAGPTPGSDLRASRAQFLRASPPMFRSRTLDRLTRVHPAVPALLFCPLIVVLLLHALQRMPAYDALLEVLAGWILWTLTEYWVHRTVFHFEPERGLGERLHWMIHGVHHDHPNDPMRLVMPPILSLPIGAACFGLFVLVLGTVGWAVCAGFFTGYLVYDMLHFALHHHRPRSRAGRLLHQLHMRHHFEDEHRGFGVSAPWWDLAFGTRARRAGSPREPGSVGSPPRS